MITGKLYNYLKFLALVVLPALGTLYVALAALWGLPSAQAVSGTILAVDTFLGALLQISSSNYNSPRRRGRSTSTRLDGGKLFDLNLDGDPEVDLEGKDRTSCSRSTRSKATPEASTASRAAGLEHPERR
jgi:hypothetical protein